jgi:hypothetical protein
MKIVRKIKEEFEKFKKDMILKGLTEESFFNYIKGYTLEMCFKCKTLNAYMTCNYKGYSYFKCMKCGFRWVDEESNSK